MNTRSRLLWSSFASINLRMSNKTKPPTHYETLEVNQRATQSEIKSAYFKLSKEYHPDKNRNEAATAKFRDIAEAYEVLGNFQSRKMYDRNIITQSKFHAPHRTSQTNQKVQQHQESSAIFKAQQKSGSTPIFDFNTWTKEHYGKTLRRTLKDRVQSASKRETRADATAATNSTNNANAIFLLITIAIIIVIITKSGVDYDEPFLVTRKDVPVDERTRGKNNMQDNGTTENLLAK